MSEDADRRARAALSVLAEPGDGTIGALVSTLGAVGALEMALAVSGGADLARAAGVDPDALARGRRRWGPRRGDLGHALPDAQRCGAMLLTPADETWPARVADLGPYAPVCLWVRGDAAAVSPATAVALVGARAASAYGEQVATDVAGELAADGVTIVSGAAYGIDAAAHRAALTVRGTTVAFLAGGVDRLYPAGNTDLLHRIGATGAVVSEVPCGSAPTKWRFLARNRLIAAASDAVVVVEAGSRSGSLNTASHAAALGRPLGAVPGPVTSSTSAGCHQLLRTRDAECITGVRDVREMLGGAGAGAGDAATPGRTDDGARVCDALSTRAPRPVEDVARRAGMSLEDVRMHLGLLELEARVRRADHGWCLVPGPA